MINHEKQAVNVGRMAKETIKYIAEGGYHAAKDLYIHHFFFAKREMYKKARYAAKIAPRLMTAQPYIVKDDDYYVLSAIRSFDEGIATYVPVSSKAKYVTVQPIVKLNPKKVRL